MSSSISLLLQQEFKYHNALLVLYKSLLAIHLNSCQALF